MKHNHPVRWWILVVVNIVFVIAGQTAGVLLGRFYYDQGGSTIFMASLARTAGFPIVLIPFFLLPRSASSEAFNHTPKKYITVLIIYITLGILIASFTLLYSLGLLYLSASTYYLISATHLAFNVIFSFFINKEKLTALILASVGIVTFSAAFLAINHESSSLAGASTTMLESSSYIVGVFCTLGAAALSSLFLSLMQLTFDKVLNKKKEATFSVVLEVQIWTTLVATIVSVVGLFASEEWKTVAGEMDNFLCGKTCYVMTLVWTAVSWQVCSVGVVGLVFLVSSLFSNVMSTVALAVGPIAAVIAFRDEMNGVKIIALIQAFWGFGFYTYQNYLDAAAPRTLEFEAETAETSDRRSSC